MNLICDGSRAEIIGCVQQNLFNLLHPWWSFSPSTENTKVSRNLNIFYIPIKGDIGRFRHQISSPPTFYPFFTLRTKLSIWSPFLLFSAGSEIFLFDFQPPQGVGVSGRLPLRGIITLITLGCANGNCGGAPRQFRLPDKKRCLMNIFSWRKNLKNGRGRPREIEDDVFCFIFCMERAHIFRREWIGFVLIF